MDKEIKIRRVPIDKVLDILHHLYQNGVDFVDIHGHTEGDVDVLGVSFQKEYMDPDYLEAFEELHEEDLSTKEINVKPLSDDELNQLMQ